MGSCVDQQWSPVACSPRPIFDVLPKMRNRVGPGLPIDFCINNAIMGVEALDAYAQTEGER